MIRVKTLALIVCATVLYSEASAQCKHTSHGVFRKRVYTLADSMPLYVGGGPAMLQFIAENYHYPDSAEFQTSFKIEFIVNKRGRISEAKVLSKSKEQETLAEKELIRVMKEMPRWKPGKCRGKRVSVQMTLPLYF